MSKFLKQLFCWHKWQAAGMIHLAGSDEVGVEKVCAKCEAVSREHEFMICRKGDSIWRPR